MADSEHRVVSRDLDNGHRVIAVTTHSDTGDKTDDEIIDSMLEWSRQRRLHAVDDE